MNITLFALPVGIAIMVGIFAFLIGYQRGKTTDIYSKFLKRGNMLIEYDIYHDTIDIVPVTEYGDIYVSMAPNKIPKIFIKPPSVKPMKTRSGGYVYFAFSAPFIDIAYDPSKLASLGITKLMVGDTEIDLSKAQPANVITKVIGKLLRSIGGANEYTVKLGSDVSIGIMFDVDKLVLNTATTSIQASQTALEVSRFANKSGVNIDKLLSRMGILKLSAGSGWKTVIMVIAIFGMMMGLVALMIMHGHTTGATHAITHTATTATKVLSHTITHTT